MALSHRQCYIRTDFVVLNVTDMAAYDFVLAIASTQRFLSFNSATVKMYGIFWSCFRSIDNLPVLEDKASTCVWCPIQRNLKILVWQVLPLYRKTGSIAVDDCRSVDLF
jgi:hypothetical protein